MGKFIRYLKKSSVVKYLRELSIVIIGVLITLTITNLTSLNSKRKEVRDMVELIKIELRDNLESIEEIEQRWITEQRIFSLVKTYIDDLEQIPPDTLKNHIVVIGALHSVLNEKDSYEIFKSSLLTQYVKDKDFLRRLSRAYRRIEGLNTQLIKYSDVKSEAFKEIYKNLSEEEIQQWTQGQVYDYFRIPLNYTSYRSFVYAGGSIISPNEFERSKKAVRAMLEEIEKRDF